VTPYDVASDRGDRAEFPGPTTDALWADFASAEGAHAFYAAWLALQCGMVRRCQSGMLLLAREDGTYGPAAVWPSSGRDLTHLAPAAEQALLERRGVLLPAANGVGMHAAYPVGQHADLPTGVVVLELNVRREAVLQDMLRRLHWGVGWLESHAWRARAQEEAERASRAAVALDILAATEEHDSLEAAAMAAVNEIATRLQCSRVALGLVQADRVRLVALSHVATIERRVELVEALENAMEEALDQSASIASPPLPRTAQRMAIGHGALLRSSGSTAVLTATMPAGSGAITLERDAGALFTPSDLSMAEAVAALVGPTLARRMELRRWVTGRAVGMLGKGLRSLLGPRHPTAKLAAMAAALLVAFLCVVPFSFRVAARAVLEGEALRAAVAPFDGFVAHAPVRAGERVEQGQVLAALKDSDLELEQTRWASERDKLQQRYWEALARRDRAASVAIEAQLRQAEAQLALAQQKLARTEITAPVAGFVVSGDLSQMVGSPVEQGRVLFEIAPLSGWRVALQVDERDLRWVRAGQHGEVALSGLAGTTLPVTIMRTTSVANAQDGRNTFRVEARIDGFDARLRPGMEGAVKVSIGRASLAWTYTRSLRDWLALQWWSWTP
jgi:multidrug efflux pump subunit AcrA (membrane-fusion protein)